jgi:hypothetical protein
MKQVLNLYLYFGFFYLERLATMTWNQLVNKIKLYIITEHSIICTILETYIRKWYNDVI